MVSENPRRHRPDRTSDETNSTDSNKDNAPDPAASGAPFGHRAALGWSLWRILIQIEDRRGAKVSDVLDAAEEHGIDRFWASEMLMFWLERGDIRKSTASNRVVSQRGRWMP